MGEDELIFQEVSLHQFVIEVRRDLGLTGARAGPPQHPEEQRDREEQRRHVQAIEARLAASRSQLVEQLARMAEASGWQVLRAVDGEEACHRVLELAARMEAQRVALTAHPALERLSLAQRLAADGRQVTVATAQDDSARQALRQALAEADLGISGVDYALAETGSCVLLPRGGVSRLVSLLPPVYLAIVETAQVVETLDDLLALRRLAFLEDGRLGSYMSIITGPSRTADIEQTLVIGAHGPREAHMLIIGSD